MLLSDGLGDKKKNFLADVIVAIFVSQLGGASSEMLVVLIGDRKRSLTRLKKSNPEQTLEAFGWSLPQNGQTLTPLRADVALSRV
jgi:hypothetical protein